MIIRVEVGGIVMDKFAPQLSQSVGHRLTEKEC
jgi:hypothetical protein